MLISLFSFPTTATASADPSPSQIILERLTARYNLNPLPRWALEHRLFRETAKATSFEASSGDDGPKPQRHRYLQVLNLSYQPERSYVAITTTYASSQIQAGTPATSSSGGESSGDSATVVAMPSGIQSEEFVQLMISRFGPLWTQRHNVQISNGQAFEAGDFRIRLGEVKQGHGGAPQGRGTIVEIEWMDGDHDDWETAEGVIRGFWKGLDIPGARELIKVAGIEEGFSNARQWCEVLRLR